MQDCQNTGFDGIILGYHSPPESESPGLKYERAATEARERRISALSDARTDEEAAAVWVRFIKEINRITDQLMVDLIEADKLQNGSSCATSKALDNQTR